MKRNTTKFALCLENTGNEASLILGKVYRILPDARAAKDDLIRIIDESGADMHAVWKTVATPRVAVKYEPLCPGNAALQALMEKYR